MSLYRRRLSTTDQLLAGIFWKLNSGSTGGTGTGSGGSPNVAAFTVIVVTVTTTTAPISTGKYLVTHALLQNVTANTTSVITISSQGGVKVGGLLNPPGTSGQAGGSMPVVAPPGQVIDLSQIFATGASSSDKLAIVYV